MFKVRKRVLEQSSVETENRPHNVELLVSAITSAMRQALSRSVCRSHINTAPRFITEAGERLAITIAHKSIRALEKNKKLPRQKSL